MTRIFIRMGSSKTEIAEFDALEVGKGFWPGGVIGPHFFENDTRDAVTVNEIRCKVMVTELLWSRLYCTDLDGMWFQQNGVACPIAHETIDLLKQSFPT